MDGDGRGGLLSMCCTSGRVTVVGRRYESRRGGRSHCEMFVHSVGSFGRLVVCSVGRVERRWCEVQRSETE